MPSACNTCGYTSLRRSVTSMDNCNGDSKNCILSKPDTMGAVFDITSNDSCGILQQVGLKRFFALKPTQCNHFNKDSILTWSPKDTDASCVEIIELIVAPTLESQEFLSIFDADNYDNGIIGFSASLPVNNQLDFRFECRGKQLRYDFNAQVDATVHVEFEATEPLSSSLHRRAADLVMRYLVRPHEPAHEDSLSHVHGNPPTHSSALLRTLVFARFSTWSFSNKPTSLESSCDIPSPNSSPSAPKRLTRKHAKTSVLQHIIRTEQSSIYYFECILAFSLRSQIWVYVEKIKCGTLHLECIALGGHNSASVRFCSRSISASHRAKLLRNAFVTSAEMCFIAMSSLIVT